MTAFWICFCFSYNLSLSAAIRISFFSALLFLFCSRWSVHFCWADLKIFIKKLLSQGYEVWGFKFFAIKWSSEAVAQRCSVKKVLLEISQNSQENTCARVSFLIKLQASGLQLYQKRIPGAGIFLWIFQNF